MHPIKRNVKLFKLFEDMGCDMIVWSSGGTEYAKEVVDTLHLHARVEKKFDPDVKPNLVFDDYPMKKVGKVMITV